MKLDQVYIRHYGPVQKDLDLNGNINVIRGPNESGKSLLVEALLKKLADSSVPNPVVSESPEGFVEISDGSLSDTLQDEDSLTEFCEENYNQEVRAEELRNVFVIRRGDLSFNEDDDFYSHITDKLTGRRVEDIDEIKDALIDEGRLTSGRLEISSSQSYHDAGNQLGEAEKLKEDVGSYIEEAEEKDLEQAESDLFDSKQQEEKMSQRIEDLEKAKEEEEKREQHDNLEDARETIEENLNELEDLPAESDLDDIDSRLQDLTEEEGKRQEWKEDKERDTTLAKWSIAAGAGTFGLLVLAGFPLVGVLGPIISFVGGWYFWSQAQEVSDKISELNAREESILSDARAAGIEFESREDVREKISNLREKREKLEGKNKGKKAVLERELDFEADSMRDVVQKAEAELEELEEEIDDSLEVEYDEESYQGAKKGYEDAKEKREQLEQDLQDHEEKLQDFRQSAYGLNFSVFVGDKLDLEIENLDSLRKLGDRLEDFISAIEEDAEASRTAMEIFNEIQEEEKEETAELFEEGSRATEIFQDITEDRYTKVTYDNEANQLKVEKSTGEAFTPKELSDGTKDQLYLSIRVALGEKILEGNTGFFVMDDAFLTSDASRLQTQADVVERLAENGWQIIYLSSKEDAISILSERTENEVIELNALE